MVFTTPALTEIPPNDAYPPIGNGLAVDGMLETNAIGMTPPGVLSTISLLKSASS